MDISYLSLNAWIFRYNEYVASSAKEFNQIRPNDFIYIEPLAEGKYGRFVSARETPASIEVQQGAPIRRSGYGGIPISGGQSAVARLGNCTLNLKK